MSLSALKTYLGNCHCGAFVFQTLLPEITSVYVCNCSWCSRVGWQILAVTDPEKEFKFVKGDETSLKTYRFGYKMHHKVRVLGEFSRCKPALRDCGCTIILRDLADLLF